MRAEIEFVAVHIIMKDSHIPVRLSTPEIKPRKECRISKVPFPASQRQGRRHGGDKLRRHLSEWRHHGTNAIGTFSADIHEVGKSPGTEEWAMNPKRVIGGVLVAAMTTAVSAQQQYRKEYLRG